MPSVSSLAANLLFVAALPFLPVAPVLLVLGLVGIGATLLFMDLGMHQDAAKAAWVSALVLGARYVRLHHVLRRA